jgi:hypothetical protein
MGVAGLVYLNQWEPANEVGPAEKKGVVRVKRCEGGWLLEPEDATKTLATYTLYTNSGGAIPAFIANRASQIAIGRLFVPVRKQVKDPKYCASERFARPKSNVQCSQDRHRRCPCAIIRVDEQRLQSR